MFLRKLILCLLLGLLALPFLGLGCSPMAPVWPNTPGPKVLVSFLPLYCFTKKIAAEDANVMCLMTGAGPHHFEFDYKDVLKVAKADLFLCNGLELDDGFAAKMVKNAGKKEDILIRVAAAIPHEMLKHIEEEEQPQGKEVKHHHHHHGEHDPHVWLSPPLAMIMCDRIAKALGDVDPGHRAGYVERAEKYKLELKKLHEDGLAALKNKTNRKIISQHDSLSYFAEAFKLEIVGEIRLNDGLDISAAEHSRLVSLAKKKQVSVITFEPQYPRKEVEGLQSRLADGGLKKIGLAEVDTLETAPLLQGSTNPDPDHYLTTMRKNLENLAGALP